MEFCSLKSFIGHLHLKPTRLNTTFNNHTWLVTCIGPHRLSWFLIGWFGRVGGKAWKENSVISPSHACLSWEQGDWGSSQP